ncbi:MAG: bifunctional diaminohydroxyphosphoribosylaminopyrimidine deaminase/5-amino-6-(5-phosphoribosylamino)uracil reductase RibD [Nitrospirae bacterium]|nr:MAG: bifunctional diaminohydroxyphosphoribosylaminopyrimidine deaminase/5-amino-6-(5-phosphoribosylamino)uracil reductase RibD [Nitrospirota bacterium]
MNITDKDILFMKRALTLAAKARGRTSPNPMVGAVLVKNSRIIAEDYHKKAGELHAEALAIQKAGRKAAGSALYVTLEPCCHTDKRTPPCTKAIIDAGINKVFVAMKDPNPKVSGKGIAELRKHGINVVAGILENEAKRLNEAYIKYITTCLPFVTLKIAMTLDGKIATPEGQSKWITGEAARRSVHRMRCASDAILTAIGTVKADNPELTARLRGCRNPVRIVIDPELETPEDFKILNNAAKTIIVKTVSAAIPKEERLKKKGIEFIHSKGSRVDLKKLMHDLGKRQITSLMVEGGSSLASSVLAAGIVDKAVFFIAPKIIGGKNSIPAVGGDLFKRLEDAYSVRDWRVSRIGQDLMVEGYL